MRPLLEVDNRGSDAWITVLNGAARSTFLVGPWAFKFPSYRGWRPFLRGLLANGQERMFWRDTRDPRLCPIPFSLPGGFLVVMPRCEPIATGDERQLYKRLTAFMEAEPCCPHDELDDHLAGYCFGCIETTLEQHEYDTGMMVPAELKVDSFAWLDPTHTSGAGRLVAVDYGN